MKAKTSTFDCCNPDSVHSFTRCRSIASPLLLCLLAILLNLLLPASARAVSSTWTNKSGGSWTNTLNWAGSVIADGPGSAADFTTLNLDNDVTVTLDGDRTIGTSLFDDQNSTKHNWALTPGSGGSLTLVVSAGSPIITVGSATTTISAVMAGTNGLAKSGPGTLLLSATNTYTGPTTVNAGTVLVNGKLGGGGAVTVQSGTTLGGTGAITGPVIVQSGATLSPGIGIGWIELEVLHRCGRMAISNTLTLAGTTAMDLNTAGGTNDAVVGLTTVTYGGTLVVTNLAGTLAAGDSFKLFDAGNYSGSFAAISPATPGIGIEWDMSYLPVDGSLRVTCATPFQLICTSNKTLCLPPCPLLGSNRPVETVLHHFRYPSSDGNKPWAGLLVASDGLLYGTTHGGGNHGTVFKLNTDGTGYSVLYSLPGQSNAGYDPYARLVQGNSGALYGTAVNGGSNGVGTVFTLSTNGTGYADVHHFLTNGIDGQAPIGSLMIGSDGLLYGTTYLGGSNGAGTVFKLSTNGSGYTILHHFSNTNGDGYCPQAGVVQGSDGMLYGTTIYGYGGYGTVYKLGTNGSGFTLLHNFNGNDGAQPLAGLLIGSDGMLYGTTAQGGNSTNWSVGGAVFTLSTSGTGFKVLHSFSSAGGDGWNTQFGDSLVEGCDGAIYGTTYLGGSSNLGTVFKLNKDGSNYTVEYDFTGLGNDGSYPYAGLAIGSGGTMYGTTSEGGSDNRGTVFRLDWGWSFDPPTVAGGCCSNLNLAILSSVISSSSNGCSQSYTRTWQATCNSNTAACSQTVTVVSDISPPVITSEPLSVTVIQGESVAFDVQATGAPPLKYDWYFNNACFVSGEDLDIILFTNVQPAQAGNYLVILTNRFGAVTSQVARLTVLPGATPDGILLKIYLVQGRFLLDVLVNSEAVEYWELQSCSDLNSGAWVTETNGFGSTRLEFSFSGGSKFFRARQTEPPGESAQLRTVFSRLPQENFNTGLLADIGGWANALVWSADGTLLNIGDPVPAGRALTPESFLDAYNQLRRSTLDGKPTLPDLYHTSVSIVQDAVPQRLEQYLAEQDIYALALVIVPYNALDGGALDDGRLALQDKDGNPIDPASTNQQDNLPIFVVEGPTPGSYVVTNLFVAAGLFRDVLCSEPGLVQFQVPTNFLVVSGHLDEVQIRFPGMSISYTNDQTNGLYDGFVSITPGQPFVWDFSGVPLDTNGMAQIPFVVRALLDGQPLDAVGSFALNSWAHNTTGPDVPAWKPYSFCPNVVKEYFYPSCKPTFWPLQEWNNRPPHPKDFFEQPNRPTWWDPFYPWPTLYATYGFSCSANELRWEQFGIHELNRDPTVWGPRCYGVRAGLNLRYYPATHRLADPTRCEAENLIVVVDGFDTTNERTFNSIWQDFHWGIQKMLDKGYDVLMLDYTCGNDNIQRNGYALKYVLEEIVPTYLKSQYAYNQVAVVCGSMGTQVTRYALCKSEEEGKDHHTGLVVYLDGPFRGADIPWSLQGFIKFFADVKNSSGAVKILDGLKSSAARQMLHAWLDYGPNRAYDLYYNEVNALLGGKGLPQKVRNVAVASGSGLGFSTAGSLVGATSWDTRFLYKDTGKHLLDRTNTHVLGIKTHLWGSIYLKAMAEDSTSTKSQGNENDTPLFKVTTKGGPILGGLNGVWKQVSFAEWVWRIRKGVRPVDFSPGGFRPSATEAVTDYYTGAQEVCSDTDFCTLGSDFGKHNYIPVFSALYVTPAKANPNGETENWIARLADNASGAAREPAGTRTKWNYWYGPEQGGASIAPSTKTDSPFAAIWYHYLNEDHVIKKNGKPTPGSDAFMFNELDQFSSHERFSPESVLDTKPKMPLHEHYLIGDLDGDGTDELLTINTFTRNAMLQRFNSTHNPPWELLWSRNNGWIGGWAISKGDKFFLASLTGGKKLLVSFSAAAPSWAMVQELYYESGNYSWHTLWHNNGDGTLDDAGGPVGSVPVRPTDLYAFGDTIGTNSEQMLVAYPYVCNEVRESSDPGKSGLSEAAVLWLEEDSPNHYAWRKRWGNSQKIHWLGGTVMRFGDHLEFAHIKPGSLDSLFSVNLLRSLFGGWVVVQDFDFTNLRWDWIWSDSGVRSVQCGGCFGNFGCWWLGDPRDSFFFADLDGDGLDELIAANDAYWNAYQFTYNSQNSQWWWCLLQNGIAMPPNCQLGHYHMRAGDRYFFGKLDAGDPTLKEEMLILNPLPLTSGSGERGPACILSWTSAHWDTPWTSGSSRYLGYWYLYQDLR